MSSSVDYRLGSIDARLAAIEKRLDEGGGRHKEIDGRIDRLELAEAKRTGAIATIGAAAGIIASVVVSYVSKKL